MTEIKIQDIVNVTGASMTNTRNGKFQQFNKHAVLIAEGCFVNDIKHGEWKEYYDHSGSIMIEECYVNGVNHGRFASYHPNGQLASEGNYVNGSREGYFQIYDEKGKKVRTLLFINNNLIEDIEVNDAFNETGKTTG